MNTLDIRVYDANINLLKEISDVISCQYTERSDNIGEFEIHTASAMDCLTKGNYIRIGSDATLSGVIEYVYDNTDNFNPDEAADYCVKGYSLLSIPARRITVPPSGGDGYTHYKNVSPETILYDLMDKQVINPEDTNRAISLFTSETDQARGTAITLDTRYENVVDVMQKVCAQSGLAICTSLDAVNKQIVFEVYQGVDRTTAPNRYLFSSELERINKRTFETSAMGTSNMAYTLGEGDGADRRLVKVGDGLTGLNRRELYVDARDISDENADDTSYDVVESLTARGNEKLEDAKETSAYEFSAITEDYGVKFNLGDYCVFRDDRTGSTQEGYLNEVLHVWEDGAHQITATLGKTTTNILSAIKSISSDSKIERAGLSEKFGALATQIDALIDMLYPVGKLWQSAVDVSPQLTLGGTWVKRRGFVIYAEDDTHPAGSTGGEEKHTLTTAEMPSHSHQQYVTTGSGTDAPRSDYNEDGSFGKYPQVATGSAGGGASHNNMMPYRCYYVWERTA